MTQRENTRSGRSIQKSLFAIIPLVVLLALALGARPGLASLGTTTGATATPTKTPRPETPGLRAAPIDMTIAELRLEPTPAPAPTAMPPVTPQLDPPSALTPYLAQVVERYGMDVNRRFIVVDPDLQRMTIWDPGHPVWELPISTGDRERGYRTPEWYGLVGHYVGTFQAFGVYADEGWYLFKDAGNILIHGAPYEVVQGAKVYQNLEALGRYPASRGCIRLTPEDAIRFTEWQPQGVPLVILPHSKFEG